MIDAKTFQRFVSDPAAFREALTVDVDGQPRRFGDVMDDWQRADFAAIDPALKRCVGRSSDGDAKSRAYLERPRGHSKTTDLAVTAIWALTFPTRIVRGVSFAADRDQAAILKQAMETVIRLNPWIADVLVVEKNRVVNVAKGHPGAGSCLSIETSDVGSSYGLLVDFIICDELVHWSGDGSLWHSIISTAAKRSNCLLVVISNAGFADSWQWDVRESARTDPAWLFSRLDGPQASWITPARLEEQRRMLPPMAFARLWLNQWSSGGGDALQEADVRAAFDDAMRSMERRDERWLYVAGVDLSTSRDYSAVLTVAIPNRRYDRVRLADHRIWKPALGRKIDLSEVELYLLDLDSRFGLEQIAVDPYQGELLMTRLEANTQHRRRNQQRRFWAKPWCHAVPPTGANLRESASLLIEYVTDRRLSLYPCEPLRRDMLKARCEEKSYGYRITSPRDSEGHGDALRQGEKITFTTFGIVA